jgi:hypothetical protein
MFSVFAGNPDAGFYVVGVYTSVERGEAGVCWVRWGRPWLRLRVLGAWLA